MVEAEPHGEHLLLKVSHANKQFCSESVQAHLSPEKLSFMIAAFNEESHECALPDVSHADADHPAS